MLHRQFSTGSYGHRLVEAFEVLDPFELLGHFGRVRDQEQGHLFFAAGLADHIDDLLLVGPVDVGGRLVGQ